MNNEHQINYAIRFTLTECYNKIEYLKKLVDESKYLEAAKLSSEITINLASIDCAKQILKS